MTTSKTASTSQASTKRQSPLRLVLAIALSCFAASVFYGIWAHHRFQTRCHEIGQALTATFNADNRFHGVRVHVTTQPRVFITAPDELSAATKAELERIAADIGGSILIPVSYLVPISDSVTPNQTQ